ncbi:MAG: hypothetical protein KJ717_13960, partial [Proteobacteria bacterium]|nr:hypothetical protein [Pseudomonadota bacterium]
MSEAISLLKEIRFGGYEASLITTFNAYLPFYEDVVLRHLMASGVRHNVLMMDSSQASLAIDRHPPRSAGRLYTLTPIKVGAAFHPKIILLVGKKKGTLFVGSHNMTLSGFGFNREMTNLIRYSGTGDADAAALLGSAWQDVLHWVATQGNHLTGHVSEMIMKVQDFAPWLQQSGAKVASEEYRVLASRQDAPSLWQQLREFVGTEPVKHVVISGAFFDANLSFIEQVRDALAPKELTVGFDPATVQFPVEKKLPGVSFVNSSGLGVGENHGKHAGYLHAKSIFIQHENGTMVLAVGSANPSSPAWLAPNLTKNAEMMIARKDEAALQTAEALGLTSIPTMPPLTKDDWEVARQNWDGTGGIEKNDAVSKVIIAIQMENAIRFRFPDCAHPSFLDCELFSSPFASPEVKRALLLDDEYVLALEGVVVPPILIRFIVNGKSFTGLVQCVKQIEGLSRTSSQRKFNEALASLTTGMPDIAHFIDCIKDIISISDKVVMTKSLPGGGLKKKDSEAPKKITEGAELSIGIDELDQQNIKKKQRLRSSDDLGYLLDVLLYNLRDDHQTGLEAVLEERDAKGRSEEEQVDADDEDEVPPVFPPSDREQKTPGVEFGNCTSARDADRNPLDVCHQKVRSLVSIARKKLDALKLGNMDLPQFVVILAGVLSTLRLLRGFDGKVPWIGAG